MLNSTEDIFSPTNLSRVTVDPEFGLEGGEEIQMKVFDARMKFWNPAYDRYYEKNYKARLRMRRGRSGKLNGRRLEDVAHEDAVRIASKFADEDPRFQEAMRQIEKEYGALFIKTGTGE